MRDFTSTDQNGFLAAQVSVQVTQETYQTFRVVAAFARLKK